MAGISKYFEASLAIVGNFFDFPSTIQVDCFQLTYQLNKIKNITVLHETCICLA